MESISKSNEKSDLIRTEGNQYYVQKKFNDALLKYNESLCSAEPEGSNLGLAYANRAAIYSEMKLYDKCLSNIKMAKENHYPEHKVEILNKREAKCFDLLKQHKVDKRSSDLCSHIKLTYQPHKKLPYIADCLDAKTDLNYGRYVVTNRPLQVGDIVAIEESCYRILQERFIYQRCSGCFKDNLMDLIPCGKCRKAMFCSHDCFENSFNAFHRLECPLMEIITSSLLNSNMRMALRIFFVALSLFNRSISELENFLNENSYLCTVFDFEYPPTLKQKLLIINSLISSNEIDFDSSIIEPMFQISPELFTMWNTHHDFMKKFLVKQCKIASLNYHEIYCWPLKTGGLEKDNFGENQGSLAYKRGVISTGNGSFPFCSLLNHHCSPNIGRIFVDGKIVLIVQRPINQGGQLFDNYGYSFTNTPKEHRQRALMRQYKFMCNCEACDNDWALLPLQRPKDKLCLLKAKEECRELLSGSISRSKAIEKYKYIFLILENCKNNFPSLELLSLMESASAYLELSLKPEIQFP